MPVVVALLLALLLVPVPLKAQAKPVGIDQVVAMLRSGMTEERIRDILRPSCLSDQLTEDRRLQLRRAGASGGLVDFLANKFTCGGAAPTARGALHTPGASGAPRATSQPLGVGFGPAQFVAIPAGTFLMGSKLDSPVHTVTISRSFSLQKTEVTQGQWAAVMGSNPSRFSSCGSRCPVEQVSWDDVRLFIERLNQRGTERYRLPTEGEWEYAARAGSTEETYGPLEAVAWYAGNAGVSTHPVAEKQPNRWGLYDMLGNVWEWVEDWYGRYAANAAVDPHGPATGTGRVVRGGSWANRDNVGAARRPMVTPSTSDSDLGFRLVRTP